MHADTPPHPDRLVNREPARAVIGWTHRPLPQGIELTIQSAASSVGLENGQIAACRLAMTHNQSLLLARYLLTTGGHAVADLQLPDARRPWWRRLLGGRGGTAGR